MKYTNKSQKQKGKNVVIKSLAKIFLKNMPIKIV